MIESFPYLIAIDGGGTSCRFALTTPAGRHELKLGSANVFSDFDRAIGTILEGLRGLMEAAGLNPAELEGIPVYAGLAGVTDQTVARRVARHLPSGIVGVEDDRRSAVVGALGDRTGSLIGVGTGSFLARQDCGEIRFAGGYGPLIGDQASGNWLGLELFRQVLLTMDGVGSSTPLTDEISARFGDDPMRLVEFSGQARPADFASFAPAVVGAAGKGDKVGLYLMQRGADYLMVVLRSLGWTTGEPICAIGGVAPHYVQYLPPEMAGSVIAPLGSALDGAMVLAQRLAQRHRQGAA